MKTPRRTHYPRAVRVRDEIYEIKITRRPIDKDGRLGECDLTDKKIKVLWQQSSIDVLNSFIHELLHALDEEYAVRLKHRQVYKLADAISDLLINNDSFGGGRGHSRKK